MSSLTDRDVLTLGRFLGYESIFSYNRYRNIAFDRQPCVCEYKHVKRLVELGYVESIDTTDYNPSRPRHYVITDAGEAFFHLTKDDVIARISEEFAQSMNDLAKRLREQHETGTD